VEQAGGHRQKGAATAQLPGGGSGSHRPPG